MTYPEHEKIKALGGDNQKIGAFLDWLFLNQGYVLAKLYPQTGYVPENISIERLLARYFSIDLKKLDAEKEQMLAQIRATYDRAGN